jgi:hypothetical protein
MHLHREIYNAFTYEKCYYQKSVSPIYHCTSTTYNVLCTPTSMHLHREIYEYQLNTTLRRKGRLDRFVHAGHCYLQAYGAMSRGAVTGRELCFCVSLHANVLNCIESWLQRLILGCCSVYVCMYVCVCVYVCMYVCMYVCTWAH